MGPYGRTRFSYQMIYNRREGGVAKTSSDHLISSIGHDGDFAFDMNNKWHSISRRRRYA